MSFVVILLGLAVVFYLTTRKKRAKAPRLFPERWHKILEERVVFYKNLSREDQARFDSDVQRFLASVRITGVQTEIDIVDKLLIASSAVIPVFGFPGWDYTFLDEVIVYPSSFDSDFKIGSKKEFIQGMVGNGAMEGKMVLSKKALHQGFSNDRDKKNVGIHEFIHLIDKEDGLIDGIPTILNDRSYSVPWLNLISDKIEKMRSANLGINNYGATNKQEFLAVIGEYFFERPHLLKSHHPDIYGLLAKAFNQEPTRVIRAKKFPKEEIGRNDLCPCGSGLKYKKCCMNRN